MSLGRKNVRESEPARHEPSGLAVFVHEMQRRFTAFEYESGSWSQSRWVVVECEFNAKGTNRRAIVTNRSGARIMPEGTYDGYADRDESGNRNKELKCQLSTDWLSDHRYMANASRTYFHCLAYLMLLPSNPPVMNNPGDLSVAPEYPSDGLLKGNRANCIRAQAE